MDNERIKNAILLDGFFFCEDPEIAKRVDDFAKKDYPFQTEEGLAFLQATLHDKRAIGPIESLFERSGLGMFKVFGPHPDTARAPLNKTTDKLLVLTVFHCLDETTLVLYENSHRHELDAEPGGTGLLELPRGSMARHGITERVVEFPVGGLLILDGRVFSTIVKGIVLEVGFADVEELMEWAKMPLPDSTALKALVQGMGRERIRMNFKFVATRKS